MFKKWLTKKCDHEWLVYCDPRFHLLKLNRFTEVQTTIAESEYYVRSKLFEANPGVLLKPIGWFAIEPAAFFFKRLRQVPVKQRHLADRAIFNFSCIINEDIEQFLRLARYWPPAVPQTRACSAPLRRDSLGPSRWVSRAATRSTCGSASPYSKSSNYTDFSLLITLTLRNVRAATSFSKYSKLLHAVLASEPSKIFSSSFVNTS